MIYIPMSYRQKLKQLSVRSPWIAGFEVKPAPGHVDLTVRFLDLCEMAMRTTSPVFSAFAIKHKHDEMVIIAYPSDAVAYDAYALQQAIELTLNESKIVCPNCGAYQTFGQSLKDIYVCCPASGELVLWQTIPDIMVMPPKERDALFDMVLTEETAQQI